MCVALSNKPKMKKARDAGALSEQEYEMQRQNLMYSRSRK